MRHDDDLGTPDDLADARARKWPDGGAPLAPAPKPTANDMVTEDGAAMEFAARYGDKLRYCHDTGAWFNWTGAIWKPERTGLAFHWARELARRIAQDGTKAERNAASKTTFATGVERFARADRAFAVTIENWDADPLLLGTPGGTVDLRTGELMRADPTMMISKSTAVTPAPQADCPRWLAFLDESTGGDAGLIRFLQQWSGYCLTGETKEHALVFVHGPGGNGKSVFVNALTGILGDYATTAGMDTFTAAHGDRHPTDLAMLRGARLVTASETEEGRAWAEARIKSLTGGDPITARFMRQDFFTYMPSFKLTIVGNHQPALRSVDDAARRRFNVVPFTRKPAKPDPDLETTLRNEWPGILRWMIEGALDWQQAGLVRPDSVRAATADYFDEQDLFAQWLEDACEIDHDNEWRWETTVDLFASWAAYARAAGEDPGTTKRFAPAMRRQGISPKRTKTMRGWAGIRLRKNDAGDG